MDSNPEREDITNLCNAESDQFVCKYMPICRAVSLALPNGTVWMSPFSKMNDPRETIVDRFQCDAFTGDSSPPDRGKTAREFGSALAHQTGVFCATRDKFSNGNHTKIMQRGFGKPRMWAQYANDHTGACLVFDRKLLVTEIKNSLEGQPAWAEDVDYNPLILEAGASAFHVDYFRIRENLQDYLVEHAEKWYLSLFFRKHEDWEGENEWRIATVNPYADGRCLEYGDALKYVVLGHRIDAEHVEEVRANTTVPVLRLRYQQWNEDFTLNITSGA